ncbi:hypothetical protein DPMN_114192 [Dreissena polymorpha]|uniref:Uncharacterized protein n=1 Tax=Dreissena polymorpha TaxID=45954 RepID=A0A9D4QRC0_DREPO|nr:hypothetical protein DPMN_114192 [Dreissena polymorpha]
MLGVLPVIEGRQPLRRVLQVIEGRQPLRRVLQVIEGGNRCEEFCKSLPERLADVAQERPKCARQGLQIEQEDAADGKDIDHQTDDADGLRSGPVVRGAVKLPHMCCARRVSLNLFILAGLHLKYLLLI